MKCKYILKNGQKLYSYCTENHLSYGCISFMVRYYSKKWVKKNLEEIINYVLDKYIKRKRNNDIIAFIKNIEERNIVSLLNIATTLNIEYNAMRRVQKYGFSKKEAFYIVWFLYDRINKSGKISISNKKIVEFIDIYNTIEFDIENELMVIILFIKLGNNEAKEYLLRRRQRIIMNIINRNIYNRLYYQNNKEDIFSEIMLNELKLYNNIYLNNIPQIMKYLNIHAKYAVIKYINNDKEKNNVHFEDSIFENKCRYDFISS